jgi:4-phytase/acid phosphatase
MVVILSRHGVRSPTWTEARLNSYSAMPWPDWNVPPGNLTSRGFELAKRFGSFDRASLAETGLLYPSGCTDAAATYVWADTEQRTIESGRALAEGLFPGCPPAVHHLPPGTNDPLFHPIAAGSRRPPSDGMSVEPQTTVRQPLDARQDESIAAMQRVLLGCSPTVSCTTSHAAKAPLVEGTGSAVRGGGNHAADSDGPLGLASSFAEDFLLEYADGMPESQIGWGHVDEAQLRRFLTFHTDYFELAHRAPAAARVEASNMLFHIVRTLEQGVDGRPADEAVGPAGSKVVILAGHDTNIAGVTALLGLHWTLDGRSDDTPPGTELAFELWQDDRGAWSVRVTVSMQTLRQMREMEELTLAAPPARKTLSVQGCGPESNGCSWEDFRKVADGVIDKDDIFTAKSN